MISGYGNMPVSIRKTGSALYYKDIEDENGNVTGRETTKDQNAASYYYMGDAIPDLYGGFHQQL